MADENAADDMSNEDVGGAPAKEGKGKVIFKFLKWIIIGIVAVIFVVTVVVITTLIINKNSKPVTAIPASGEYTTQKEVLDWYTSLDQIRTSSSDPIPASIVVTVALGYKQGDKSASTEITSRRIELTDFLRRFFSEQTLEGLKPQNEEALRQNIRDQINDEILSNTRIKDVRFTTKDVVSGN